MVHSSSSSGIFFEGDEHSQGVRNSHLSSNLVPPSMYSNMVPVSGEVSNAVMDSMASSGLSIGASSLVTDANSGLSGGTQCVQRTASNNTESYMRLPASPLSFSSNNISISGSSAIDGQSPVQQTSNQDPNFHQMYQQGLRQGASTATSLPNPRLGSSLSDHDNVIHVQKKPRIDIGQDDIMQQRIFQQMLQRQDSMQSQSQSPNVHLQALYHQRQLLQSLPPLQRAQFLQQQQQQQQRQNLQQQGVQPNRSYDGGVCSRRLMQYLYHQRQRPADINYWRKFVAEYYSPRAKKRWCLSLHNNIGHHRLGVFSPATVDVWQCGICGSKSGRGFEATFEILPRLNEIKLVSGVKDELWFLDLARECRFPSGIMMLEYGKAVHESVYEQLRVVHEGRLKVIFTPDLKILTWEFCSRHHEELLPRRLVAPQVNQLLEVAQKLQSKIAESGSGGVSQQDLQTNTNIVVAAGRQLARSLETQSVNDLGFTKTYVRCLQTAEVANSMIDLIDITLKTKIGPIEALKNFPRIGNDRNALNPMGGRGVDYQNMMMMRQRLMNSNSQQDNRFQGRVLQNNNSGGYQRFPGGVFQFQQNHQQPPAQGGGEGVQHHQMMMVQQGGGGSNLKPAVSGNSYKGGGSQSDLGFEDIGSEFLEDGLFNNDEHEDGAGYSWKT